jgi:hypothetical protein
VTWNIVLSLFTGFCTAAAFIFAIACSRHSEAAQVAAHELRKRAGQIDLLREDQAALAKRLAKLTGRFYRELRDQPDDDTPTAGEGNYAYPAPRGPDGRCYDICENWNKARIDGPGSLAANCECAYCEASRRERHNVKAALVPKSQADRIAAMRRGLEQP